MLENKKIPPKDYLTLLKKLYRFLDSFYDERMTLIQFKKFSAWFSSGYPDSTVFRKSIFQMKDKTQALESALEYFQKWSCQKKSRSAYEAFLMQGHG